MTAVHKIVEVFGWICIGSFLVILGFGLYLNHKDGKGKDNY